MNKQLIIAIDGYSACGKSTIAKDVANVLDYTFIDTGAMYRGVALYAINHQLIQDDVILTDRLADSLPNIHLDFKKNEETGKRHLFLNGTDVEEIIRRPEVAAVVSRVAAIKEVRYKLVASQREMGKNGGVVMDGRDIGSVVFPDADLKFFVTADPVIRAERRRKEMQNKGIEASLESVLQNLQERDQIDRTRAEGPLIQTPDAILIDTSHFTRESQLAHVLNIIREKFGY